MVSDPDGQSDPYMPPSIDDTTTTLIHGLFCIVFQVCRWYSKSLTREVYREML